MVLISRRAALGGVVGAGVAASWPGTASARDLADGVFTHGVASGDPLATSVVPWTRFVPKTRAPGDVRWQVARDEGFRSIVAQGRAIASAATDFCIKVDAGGLAPDGRYFFRFLSRSGPSPVGLTRTTPERGRAPLTIAGFACSALPAGYFRAYADAAARPDIDLCAHVGDYIYEYSMQLAQRGSPVAGRTWEPDRELLTYADYCSRYASYRSDPDLRELHRVKPFLAVWDDHEFSNDAWRDGAQNHQPDSEGPWLARRDAAAKAWSDWLPVRVHPNAPRRIHHGIKWGDLAQLVMLDSRLMRDNQPPAWTELLALSLDKGDAAFNADALRLWRDVIGDPRRTLLGSEQEDWFKDQLVASRATGAPWQVVIEGSVLGRFNMPKAAESWLGPNASERERKTAAILTRVGALGLPFDAPLWNGFPAARERFLSICAAHGSNVFAFGGETHSGWAFNLPGGKQGPAAVEVALTAVTSSNSFRAATGVDASREAAFLAASSELAWCDVHHWGYTKVRFDETAAKADWIGFRSVATPDAPITRQSTTIAETGPNGVRPWSIA